MTLLPAFAVAAVKVVLSPVHMVSWSAAMLTVGVPRLGITFTGTFSDAVHPLYDSNRVYNPLAAVVG